ncbi:signal recognition particle protein SRP54, putative [Cryptosporidium muris RN66]|uniref:Signal recognition particle 54 kDa protein n=1 Tax=Cryptosporidium muris (strain RN66) TaxID=441375 RepID=B6AFJ0_CRYMR|nr:signal recognition particle protein SRP54, putative [Cryptosporidium muris RN66]EEA06981.1 signal recognition particle protein SRP54, putative [Cryptosporidium muris RN66]|eukprot:XP_002141330.1 signal recognition particle protein SRP54 [Cryptosporidium muris RN66]
MVLAELGTQLTAAIKKLQSATIVDEATIDNCLREIATALLQADVNVKLVAQLRNNIKKAISSQGNLQVASKRRLIQASVVEELVKILTPQRKPYVPTKDKCNIVVFVGLQGSGKTTTCTKYAHYYQRKGWKTALVCADTFRAGAFDQLKQNATKAKIPFYGSYTETDPVKIASDGVKEFRDDNYDLIIVDTSGRHKQESSLFVEMQQIVLSTKPDNVVFVMDSHIGQACYDQALAFCSVIDVGSVIITKLDGHAKGGGALSAVAATSAPIIFIGTGEHFDDFEPFETRGFVSRLLGLGDISGLFAKINEVVPIDKQPEMVNRIVQGIFTLRDMYEQFQNMLNMGSPSALLSMIPGFGPNFLAKEDEQAGITRLRRFMVIMDSMTDAELDNTESMISSRITRVAIGSGTNVCEVQDLLNQYKTFAKMVGQIGKMGLGKKGDMGSLKNPLHFMQKMQRMIDPRMLKQLGGSNSMFNMMKEMEKMENSPDLQKLFRGIGM